MPHHFPLNLVSRRERQLQHKLYLPRVITTLKRNLSRQPVLPRVVQRAQNVPQRGLVRPKDEMETSYVYMLSIYIFPTATEGIRIFPEEST
jgi:hypothetical protein